MNAIADTARQNAMQVEAKKDGLSQLQSGEWVLKLKLHAADIPTPLLTANMGTRYMLAVVEIGDNEEPVQQEKPKGKSYAQQAAMCCGEPGFHVFCHDTLNWEISPVQNEERIAEQLRAHCGVISRADLIEGTEAGTKWRKLWLDYQNWLKT